MNWKCLRCGQCCKRFYPEVTQEEIRRIKKYLSEERWVEFKEHIVDSSPYQKEKAFPDNQFIKPPCPLLTEKNRCSIHSICKLNSCTHWFCGRKSLDEPLAPVRAIKFWIKGIRFLMKDGSIVDPTMTAHLESCYVGGVNHRCLKKDTPADSAGEQKFVSFGTIGYKNFLDGLSGTPHAGTLGWAFQLTGVAKILASTWTYYFRVYKTGGAGHGNLAAQIRKNADASLRATIIDVSASGDTAEFPTSYGTVNGSYAISEYTVVDETDWLICYWFGHCTTGKGGKKAYLRYDDNGLAEADQTRITNVSFQAALLRQLTENLSVIQAVFSWHPRPWIFKLILNLSVLSDVFSHVPLFKRMLLQNLSVIADKISSVYTPLIPVYKLTQNLSVISTVPTRIYGAVRPIRLNLSVIADVFSSIYTPLLPVYKFIQNLSVLSTVPTRIHSGVRTFRLNLSSISDVFGYVLTKAPIVRQFIETLVISMALVKRYSAIKRFIQNLSSISDVFSRDVRYTRRHIQETLISDVFKRIHGIPRTFVEDLSVLSIIFTRRYVGIRTFIQNLSVIKDVFKRFKGVVIPFPQNLSVISDIFVRKYSGIRKFVETIIVRDLFKRIIGFQRKFIEDLSVIADKFTSIYTPIIVEFVRTFVENLSVIQDVFKRVYGVPRAFVEDLSVTKEVFSRKTVYLRKLPQTTLVQDVFKRVVGFPRKLIENLSIIKDVFTRKVSYIKELINTVLVRDAFKRSVGFPRKFIQNLSTLSAILVRKLAFLRRLRQNLSVIQEVFVRVAKYVRAFPQQVVIRVVFSFVFTPFVLVYKFVQNLSAISDFFSSVYTPLVVPLKALRVRFVRIVTYDREVPQEIIIAERFKVIKDILRKIRENLSVIQDIFSFVYTPFVKIYKFVENLSVISVKLTSTYTPFVKIYKLVQTIFIQALSVRRVSYLRGFVNHILISDVFRWVRTIPRLLRQDLSVLSVKVTRRVSHIRDLPQRIIIWVNVRRRVSIEDFISQLDVMSRVVGDALDELKENLEKVKAKFSLRR